MYVYSEATPEARLVVAEVSDGLQDLLPTNVYDTTTDMDDQSFDESMDYQISSVICKVMLSGNHTDLTDLDITLTLGTHIVRIIILLFNWKV